MHWCLVRFDRDLLATSDHPLVIIPFGPYTLNPASVIPESGLVDTVEVRFPVDPRTLLLMAWSDPGAPDSVVGTYRAACNSNSAVVAQALEEWFYLPGTTPSFLVPLSVDRDASDCAASPSRLLDRRCRSIRATQGS